MRITIATSLAFLIGSVAAAQEADQPSSNRQSRQQASQTEPRPESVEQAAASNQTIATDAQQTRARQKTESDRQTESGEQQTSRRIAVPDGQLTSISPWGYSGVLWSDAHLVRRLAIYAAENAESDSRTEQLNQLVAQCDRLIDSLEEFGWRRIRSGSEKQDTASGNQNQRSGNNSDNRPTVINPGSDPERFDVGRYRVNDQADRLRNQSERAEARRDGAEAALATGVDTIRPDTQGRISRREAVTGSSTLPYADDTIYDSDDYDPDVDYRVDRPEGAGNNVSGIASVRAGSDDRDDIDNAAEVVDSLTGEDETTAPDRPINRTPAANPLDAEVDESVDTPTSERIAAGRQSAQRASESADGRSRTRLDRFTTEGNRVVSDADWVQYHLDLTQAKWERIAADARQGEIADWEAHLHAALTNLRASAATITTAIDGGSFAQVLNEVP